MPINLREDVAFIILKKIKDSGSKMSEVNFTETDFTGRGLTKSDFLGHLDYLNQKQYIQAKFSGNAYANQEDVPSAVNPDEVNARVANTLGAEDGPLPHLIQFEEAKLTDKGQKLLEKMEKNPPEALDKGPATPIATKNMPFLEKVMLKGNLNDIFDARDISEVVFRTMRDMMSNEASERVSQELHEPAEPTKNKALQNEIADLWKDTNPIVAFLSKVRPPLKIDSDTFLFRVRQEGGLQKGVDERMVVKSVFSATKEELSQERIKEVEGFLPDTILELWKAA
ncbi:hypothetical protein NIES267_46100 [Calothrix parasitica NIES-267]|uniref:DUF2267 domain-containing protein n=1 Tax=Calothrix parasitica NIES-267 TaxID=1973488 RepID=A0A1Z4LV46_9CYAN|nr:hypothetical protein NIES267_46100 [Calothrix parasitica NIES-267]